MTRRISVTVFAAAQCVIAGLIAVTPARATSSFALLLLCRSRRLLRVRYNQRDGR